MKRYFLLIAGLLTLSTIVSAQETKESTQEGDKKLITPDETHMFEKRDDGELFLDIYKPAEMLVFYFTARVAIKDGTFKR